MIEVEFSLGLEFQRCKVFRHWFWRFPWSVLRKFWTKVCWTGDLGYHRGGFGRSSGVGRGLGIGL